MIDIKALVSSTGLTIRATRLVDKVPANGRPYCVLFDSEELIGPDFAPGMLRRHSQTIEHYDYKIDSESRLALESALASAGLEYTRSDTEWLQQEKVYQTLFNFQQMEKRSL